MFLKIIIFILFLYLLSRLFKSLLKHLFISNINQHFNANFNETKQSHPHTSSKDGMNIKYSKKGGNSPKAFDKLGEDIDFEELD